MSALPTPWFARWPELLDWELGRFAARELPAALDEDQRQGGQLVIHTQLPYRGEPLELRVVYPSEYPELPPIVFGEPRVLDRHQHAFWGNFCLLEREFDDWRARDWGAADLVAEQLQRLLEDSAAGPEAVRTAEAPIPEPVTAFYGYADCAALVSAEVAPLPGEQGLLRVRQVTDHLYLVEESAAGNTDPELLGLFPNAGVLDVPWRRLGAAPAAGRGDGSAVAAWVRAHFPDMLAPELPPKLRRSSRLSQPPPLEIVALVFDEEGPAVGETREAYLFLAVDRRSGQRQHYLIHAQPLSRRERDRRIPELEGLAGQRAVVLGGGALGGEIAIELAKAGVGHLDIVDFDRFETTNTVRHALSIDYSGLPKSRAVATACRRANPFCIARGHELRFGETTWTDGESPLSRYAELAQAAHLVIDATGSHQIAQFASRIAAEADTAFLSCWLTGGSYGAELVRILPGRTCCWTCFVAAQRSGRVLSAEQGPTTQIVVQGCGQPTTSGAGFDAGEAAAAATRLAVQTLDPQGGYPDAGFDHATLNFRRLPDDRDYPRFACEPLTPTEDCPQCQAAAGLTIAR